MAKSKAKRSGGAKKSGKKPASAARATKATRKAKKAPARKAAPRRGPASRPSARKVAKPVKKAATPVKKVATPVKRAVQRASAPKASTSPRPKAAAPTKDARPGRAPALDRPRRTVAETEPHGIPSSLDLDRKPSAARTGRSELAEKLREHTSTGPALTGGDIDADWESAETVGDEAPGGDNPTPDQDVVDDIGKALGVEYDDDEELQGGEEIVERDRKRWELDPASKDDFEDEE